MDDVSAEVLAAFLSREPGDSRQMMSFLAQEFEGPLSHRMTVHKAGWLSKDRPIEEIAFRFTEFEDRITRHPEGSLETAVRHEVRGVVLKTEVVPIEQWVRDLANEPAQEVSRMNVSQETLARWIKE